MGGTSFEVYGEGASADKAFQRLTQEARNYHGNRGYTGSIAEKPSFKIIRSDPVPRAVAYHIANELYATFEDSPEALIVNDKWGPAAALPISEEGWKERTVKVTVRVDPEKVGTNYQDWDKIRTIFLAEADISDADIVGDIVTKVDIASDTRQYRTEKNRTNGKLTTKYFFEQPIIVDQHQRFSPRFSRGNANDWMGGFDTLAEARAYAENHCKNFAEEEVERRRKTNAERKAAGATVATYKPEDLDPANIDPGPLSFRVYGIARRHDNEPLDVIERTISKRKLVLEGEVWRKTGLAKTEGWLFFGIASC